MPHLKKQELSSKKDQVISHFAQDWGSESPQFSVCEKIFNYLLSGSENQLNHLTFGAINNSIDEHFSDADVLKAVQYLCGDKVPILSLHFGIADGEHNHLPLKYDDIRHAEKTGKLTHPVTGEDVENFEDRVLIYFTPSPLLQKLIGEK